MFKQKYLKYKKKYLELKSHMGGADEILPTPQELNKQIQDLRQSWITLNRNWDEWRVNPNSVAGDETFVTLENNRLELRTRAQDLLQQINDNIANAEINVAVAAYEDVRDNFYAEGLNQL